MGALHNLGYTISAQTVGNIRKRQGIPSVPERKKTVTWREFIDIHMAVLGVTDFFSSELWTWYRRVICSLSFFFSFGRCLLHLAGITALLNALRRWPIPPPPSAWRVAVARGIHPVMEHGMPLVLQGGERAQPPILSAYAIHTPQEHFHRCRGTLVLPPIVHHGQIRDGPRRRRHQLGRLLMDANREAA
jgi:hypothetical protein